LNITLFGICYLLTGHFVGIVFLGWWTRVGATWPEHYFPVGSEGWRE